MNKFAGKIFLFVPLGNHNADMNDLRQFARRSAVTGNAHIAIYRDPIKHYFKANRPPQTIEQFKSLVYVANQELN